MQMHLAFIAHASELEDDSYERGRFGDIRIAPLIISLAEMTRISGRQTLLDGDVKYRHIDNDIMYRPVYQHDRTKVKVVEELNLSQYKLYLESPAVVNIKMENEKVFTSEW